MKITYQIYSLLFIFTCTSASLTTCSKAILSDAPEVVYYGAESIGGSPADIQGFVGSVISICTSCQWNCSFLDQLSVNGIAMSEAGISCTRGIVDDLEGALRTTGSAGVDVMSDFKLIYGLYETFEDCKNLVMDTWSGNVTHNHTNTAIDSEKVKNEGSINENNQRSDSEEEEPDSDVEGLTLDQEGSNPAHEGSTQGKTDIEGEIAQDKNVSNLFFEGRDLEELDEDTFGSFLGTIKNN